MCTINAQRPSGRTMFSPPSRKPWDWAICTSWGILLHSFKTGRTTSGSLCYWYWFFSYKCCSSSLSNFWNTAEWKLKVRHKTVPQINKFIPKGSREYNSFTDRKCDFFESYVPQNTSWQLETLINFFLCQYPQSFFVRSWLTWPGNKIVHVHCQFLVALKVNYICEDTLCKIWVKLQDQILCIKWNCKKQSSFMTYNMQSYQPLSCVSGYIYLFVSL